MSTSFSLYKNGLKIVNTNKHFGQLQHRFRGLDLLHTLQLLNTL
jgi:hypothetical protein